MDMKDVWEEHKKFITTTGAGAIVFAILASSITGMERSAEAQARSNANGQSELLRTISGLVGQEATEKGKKNALEETAAPAILRSIGWTVDKDYLLASDDKNPTLTYQGRTVAATDEVTKRADRTGVTIPRNPGTRKADLGFEESPNLEGPRAPEALARIDVSRRIVLGAMEAGTRKILQVRSSEATYTALDGNAGFLRRIPVTILFEGGTQELARLLATFEQEGAFLEVGSCRVGRVKDSRPEEGRLEIEVELAALTVEKQAPEGASTDPSKPSDDPGRKPPVRRPRRDR